MPELTFRLSLLTDSVTGKLREVGVESDKLKQNIEAPKTIKISADQALATIRDVKIAFDGMSQVVSGLVRSMNGLLDASLGQQQAVKLASIAFGEAASEMSKFASSMQEVTNFEDDQLLALMSKLAQTFKLNKDEIQQLVPVLLDFTEANKATGMSVESAFDLMGRALNGHTEMLGRYGIELDDTRLKTEGVSYLVEKLGEDYGGTAVALADLRLQNTNAWGDIKETVGDMLTVLINPLLHGLKWLMDAYQNLSPVMKGFATGITIAIPLVGTLSTVIITLTTAISALKIAINPVVGIITLAVTVLASLGFAYAATQVAQDQYHESTKKTTESVEGLIEKHRGIAMSIDYVEAKRRLAELDTAVKQYQQTLKDTAAEVYKLRGEEYNLAQARRNQQKQEMIEAAAEAKALREKIAQDDAAARVKYNQERLVIEKKATLEGVALLEYTLAETKRHYAQMGAVNAANVDEQLQLLETIRTLEKQIATERESELAKKEADEENFKERTAQQAIDAVAEKKRLEQEKFRTDIEYYSNLEQLGVSSYDNLKATMEAYYAWAKQNMTKEEQAMILLQLQQTNLRWGEAKKAELDAIEASQNEFTDRSLELANNTYELQLRAIDRYYDKRAESMRKAGISEVAIEKQKNAAIMAININAAAQMVGGVSSILGTLAGSADKESRKGFAVWKGLSLAQATIDAIASANAAYKSMVGIPIVGPGLAIAAAAAALMAGYANVNKISNTKYEKAATGGLLVGNSHSNGGILIEAEGDEYITAKDRVRALGKGLFDWLNFAPLGQVKNALMNIPMPNVPMPSNRGFAFAGGGSIGGGTGMDTLVARIDDLIDAVQNSRPVVNVSVDPLSNDPVKVSEISEKGTRMRSAF